jgi:hypothetical protein
VKPVEIAKNVVAAFRCDVCGKNFGAKEPAVLSNNQTILHRRCILKRTSDGTGRVSVFTPFSIATFRKKLAKLIKEKT